MSLSGSHERPTFCLPHLTLVVGGARSGKSRYAEKLVQLSGRPRTYIASAQAFDDEMRDRIDQHRIGRGPDWKTIEAPLDIAGALAGCEPDCAVLFDCATLWLSNILISGSDMEQASRDLIVALIESPCPVVVVSNEVGWGIVPDNKMARQFRDAQGRLNQMIAAKAGLVVAVMAGLPLAFKGCLPDGEI